MDIQLQHFIKEYIASINYNYTTSEKSKMVSLIEASKLDENHFADLFWGKESSSKKKLLEAKSIVKILDKKSLSYLRLAYADLNYPENIGIIRDRKFVNPKVAMNDVMSFCISKKCLGLTYFESQFRV